MKKILLGLVLFLSAVSLACAAPPPVTDSGISAGSADNTIGAGKLSWDAGQADKWLVAWFKIPPGSDIENGLARYQYKITYTSPDKTGVVTAGPFYFDSIGYAMASKQISFFNKVKTGFSPRPNEGKWLVEFKLVDKQNGNKESPAALLAFYLIGSDAAQRPAGLAAAAEATATTSTTVSTTTSSTTTTSLSKPATTANPKKAATSEAGKMTAAEAKKMITSEAKKLVTSEARKAKAKPGQGKKK
jgi:hypothetical protein